MKKIFIYVLPFIVAFSITGCKKDYLETKPSDQVDDNVIFSNTEGAWTALEGIWRLHWEYNINNPSGSTNHSSFGQKSWDLVSDLMGNDMVMHTGAGTYGWYTTDYRYTAQLTAVNNGRSERIWTQYYTIISNANNIINNIDKANGAQADKDIIKGQALAIRAYSYFNLVNWFQHTYKGNENKPGVPIYTAVTVKGNPRGTVQQVYNRIIEDLTAAEPLLTGKTRKHLSHINVNVVQGIRARVALQMEDWPTAASYANKARQGYTPMSTTQYMAGFSSISNPEWMWGLQIIPDQATIYASFFSHMDVTNAGYAQLGSQKKITKALYDQIPAGDVRKVLFKAPGTGTATSPDYNQLKFRVPTAGSWAADYVLMRAAEMYLIEAEALARQGQDATAKTVLETLVKARFAAYTAPSGGGALLNEILLQRRIELWGEGFSLFDIKRLKTGLNRPTGAGNHGLPNYDPITYTLADQDTKFLMRIPQREIDASDAIGPEDQNP